MALRSKRKPARPAPQRPEDAEAAGAATDAAGRGISKLLAKTSGSPAKVLGPSPNPATNLIIQDIAMRAGGRMVRHALEKGALAGRYGTGGAKAIVENRSLKSTLLSGLLARYATRSTPGAVLIGGGLVVKTLLDRRKSRKAARAAGDQTLSKMARK